MGILGRKLQLIAVNSNGNLIVSQFNDCGIELIPMVFLTLRVAVFARQIGFKYNIGEIKKSKDKKKKRIYGKCII